jgi:hypothetical protein
MKVVRNKKVAAAVDLKNATSVAAVAVATKAAAVVAVATIAAAVVAATTGIINRITI